MIKWNNCILFWHHSFFPWELKSKKLSIFFIVFLVYQILYQNVNLLPNVYLAYLG